MKWRGFRVFLIHVTIWPSSHFQGTISGNSEKLTWLRPRPLPYTHSRSLPLREGVLHKSLKRKETRWARWLLASSDCPFFQFFSSGRATTSSTRLGCPGCQPWMSPSSGKHLSWSSRGPISFLCSNDHILQQSSKDGDPSPRVRARTRSCSPSPTRRPL